MSDDSGPSGSGGAVFVEHGGAVVFDGKTDFTYNEVGRGGGGGAVANLGSLVFTGPSAQATFTDNAASGVISKTITSPILSELAFTRCCFRVRVLLYTADLPDSTTMRLPPLNPRSRVL